MRRKIWTASDASVGGLVTGFGAEGSEELFRGVMAGRVTLGGEGGEESGLTGGEGGEGVGMIVMRSDVTRRVTLGGEGGEDAMLGGGEGSDEGFSFFGGEGSGLGVSFFGGEGGGEDVMTGGEGSGVSPSPLH